MRKKDLRILSHKEILQRKSEGRLVGLYRVCKTEGIKEITEEPRLSEIYTDFGKMVEYGEYKGDTLYEKSSGN